VRAGEVIRLRFPFSDPPKIKISLCFCIEQGLFFIVSSRPYSFAPQDSQLTIFKEELSCLQHDSFLDVSKAYEFEAHVVTRGAENGVYPLAQSALVRIRNALQNQNYLPEHQKRKALQNLCAQRFI